MTRQFMAPGGAFAWKHHGAFCGRCGCSTVGRFGDSAPRLCESCKSDRQVQEARGREGPKRVAALLREIAEEDRRAA